jgi:predicted TIM-barrel fold metal-dependent hydrolase
VAPLAAHRAVHAAIGVTRAVLVQPSAYGADHSVLAEAVARSPQTLRGVGLLGRGAAAADFAGLERAGVGALRFVEARVPGTGERYPGNFGLDDFRALRAPIAARGWHAEFWAPLAEAADICDAEAGRGVPIVLDHLAGATAATAPDDPDFRRIVRHLERGDVWIKLVLCRTARTLDEALATAPLHAVLLAANPERLVWGTDYPFIRKGADAPDPARLLATITEWAGRHAGAVLRRNPAVLYRFD